MTDKELVHASWEWIGCWEPNDDIEYGHEEWIVAIADKKCSPCTEEQFAGNSESLAWYAAAEFTRNRLEEIRQVKEERAMLCCKILLEDCDIAIAKRIIARLEAILADLKRGMRDQ